MASLAYGVSPHTAGFWGSENMEFLNQLHVDAASGGFWVTGTLTDPVTWETDVLLLSFTGDGELALGKRYGGDTYEGSPIAQPTDDGFLVGSAVYGWNDIDIGLLVASVDADGAGPVVPTHRRRESVVWRTVGSPGVCRVALP
jgi:hypothetical protein